MTSSHLNGYQESLRYTTKNKTKTKKTKQKKMDRKKTPNKNETNKKKQQIELNKSRENAMNARYKHRMTTLVDYVVFVLV